MDEGLADFHAYGASCRTAFGCNPRVLATSFEGKAVEDRDISRTWCMSANLREQLVNSNFSQFSGLEYQVGTILASALHQAAQGSQANREQLLRAVVRAYSSSDPAKPGLAELIRQNLTDQTRFTLAMAARAIVQQVEGDLQQAVCNAFANRLQIPLGELVGQGYCPSSTSDGGPCPRIN
jgi:hypothetical protein